MKFEDIINTIQLGDCYKLIKNIPDKSIDLVYIDIPYLTKNMISGTGSIKKLSGFTKDKGTQRNETRRNRICANGAGTQGNYIYGVLHVCQRR